MKVLKAGFQLRGRRGSGQSGAERLLPVITEQEVSLVSPH